MQVINRFLVFLCFALLLGCSRSPSEHHASVPRAEISKPAGPRQITERQALDLLLSALKQHKVADLDCLSFATESNYSQGSQAEQWEFAAREIHNDRCGGDPAISHVRDRYEVSSSGKVRLYDGANGEYTKF